MKLKKPLSEAHIFLTISVWAVQITQMERHMNVLVGYMLMWVLFAAIMLGAGDQIFNRLHGGQWYLQLNGTWPELGQVCMFFECSPVCRYKHTSACLFECV